MSNVRFFEETKEQSLVKSTIVSKYFWAWAKVRLEDGEIFLRRIPADSNMST